MSEINEEWKHCYDELWEGMNIEIKNLWQRSGISVEEIFFISRFLLLRSILSI